MIYWTGTELARIEECPAKLSPAFYAVWRLIRDRDVSKQPEVTPCSLSPSER